MTHPVVNMPLSSNNYFVGVIEWATSCLYECVLVLSQYCVSVEKKTTTVHATLRCRCTTMRI